MMGVFNNIRAKMRSRKEEKEQLRELGRPARLAALHKQTDLFKKRQDERDLVNHIKNLKRAERREKLAPVVKGLQLAGKGATKFGQVAKNVGKGFENVKGNAKGIKPKKSRADLFNVPSREDLFKKK